MLKTIFFVFLLCQSVLLSQSDIYLYDWNLYTSYRNVNIATIDNQNRIWGGTTGGIFVYDAQNNSFNTFNSLNGILSNNTTSLYYDSSTKLIFAGFSDGNLEIIDRNFKITHITSISSSDFPNTRINKIIAYNGFLYLATGFGIVVFDINRKIFTTNVVKIANWNRAENIIDIYIFNNRIWATSASGIAFCNLEKYIEIPVNWTTLQIPSVDNKIITIDTFNNNLIFANSREIFRFNGSEIEKIKDFEKNIKQIFTYNNSILIVADNGIYDLEQSKFFESAINSAFVQKNKIIFATTNGIIVYENNFGEPIAPNSPFNNIFSSMVVDKNGVLWSVSAHLQALFYSGGITKFENGFWENYNKKIFQNFITDNFYNISIIDDLLYSSSVGGGVAVCNPYRRPINFDFLSERNEKFVGTKTETDTFLFVGDFKSDNRGNVWFTNWGGQSGGPVLVMRQKNGTSKAYTNCYKSDERRILKLEIDNFNTKWVGSYPGEGIGIFYFNENNTPDNPSDDICGMISTSNVNALPDNSPTVIKKDPNGCIWMGFRQGLSVIFNPTAVLNKNQLIIRQINHLNNQKINDIMIDPTGHAWIATNNGVFVISYNTFELVKILNSSNSPIKSSNVLSIAGDFKKGILYFGTEDGLYCANSNILEPNEKFDIVCYPQPFKIKKDNFLTIDGLAPNSEIKIITINGEFVKSIHTTSRTALWDGKDNNGDEVSSGVYLVVGTSATTNSNGVQKIVVISN